MASEASSFVAVDSLVVIVGEVENVIQHPHDVVAELVLRELESLVSEALP